MTIAPSPDLLGRQALPGPRPLCDLRLPPRAGGRLVHLDTAACGRPSVAVLDAVRAHLEDEAAQGGYVAEHAAVPRLAQARACLRAIAGCGEDSEVSFVESATAAFSALWWAWPLPSRARVGVIRSEYASNAMVAMSRASRDGVTLVELPVGSSGRLDLAGVVDELSRGLDLVTFPQVAGHRGLAQPAAEVAAACRAAGVPLLLDAAQSLGQADVATVGADAVVGTARKWLGGPRGVGFVVVRREVAERLTPLTPSLASHVFTTGGYGVETKPVAGGGPGRLETGETSVAARVGFAQALAEHVTLGPERVVAALHALAGTVRRGVDGVAGWRVVEPVDEPTAITTLVPPPGVDISAVRLALLDAGVLTSALLPDRAPRDMDGERLRLSPWLDVTSAGLETFAAALLPATDRNRHRRAT